MLRTARPLSLAMLVSLSVVAVAVGAGVGVATDREATPDAPLVADRDPVSQAQNPCVGTIREEPDSTTLYSIQGARGGNKTSAMTVGVRPNGSVVGVHNDTAAGRWWTYDIDVIPNGNVLAATTVPGHTVIEEIDPETGEHVSRRDFRGVHDAHDVDLINGDELLVNDMSRGGNDSFFVYNLTREEVVWEYRFAEHTDEFPKSEGGEFGDDWTHNNDVEKVEDGVYMVSVRNFDEVVAINRSTKEVEWRLGEDGETDILYEQHNPDYLETEDGRATVIVADSLNDRVVEYTREDGEWNRTWALRGGNLDEPRDADRLPNGNTLVADRRGHRILEVTPGGEVVWEAYAPWQPYDVERLGTGDESSGPTMADANASGPVEMTGSAGPGEAEFEACYDYLTSMDRSRLIPEEHLDDIGSSTDTGDGIGEDGIGNATRTARDTGSGGEGLADDSVLGTETDGGNSGVFGPTPLKAVLPWAMVAVLVLGGLVRFRRR